MKAERELSRTRIESYSDGVFAIVATLLVLDVKLPKPVHELIQVANTTRDLLGAILTSWPLILSYFLSFLTITIWWITHHHLFHVIQKVDRTALWLNSIFLMFLAITPFPTAILGQAPGDSVAVCFYGLCMVPIGISIATLRWYMTIHTKLADPKLSASLYRSAMRKGFSSPLLYLASAGVGYCVPWLGICAYIAIALYYFLPSSLDRHSVAMN